MEGWWRKASLPLKLIWTRLLGYCDLNLAHGAGEDDDAVVDEADGVAHLFDLIHAVGGEEDGSSLLAEVDEGVDEQAGVDGIEAAEGLVHDDELGLVQQGGNELDLLLHSLGEVFGLLWMALAIWRRSHHWRARRPAVAASRHGAGQGRRAGLGPSSSCRGRAPRAGSRRA